LPRNLPRGAAYRRRHAVPSHGGTISKKRRRQFADVVPEAAFDFIEATVRRRLAGGEGNVLT
jgi:hypothetical protein